jgi:porin
MICSGRVSAFICVLLSFTALPLSGALHAQEPSRASSLTAIYKGDVIAYDGGSGRRGSAFLDLLSIVGEADLGRAVPGLLAHVHVENTSGGAPNNALGTARGFDNSEVDRQRLRLYEAWVEQSFSGGSVLLGFYDFNSEFNATASSGLFLGPGFGISTEISGATANGPSIFPSTGLGLRARLLPSEGNYIQAAVINARIGVPGDPGGAQFDFGQGVLVAGEAGFTRQATRVALGAWRYSRPIEDSRSTSKDDHTQGAYVLIEQRLGGEGAPTTGFLRAGISDGRTGDFAGGLQAGVSLAPALRGRPDSAFGLGVDHVAFSDGYRRDQLTAGGQASGGETALELTYADRLFGPVFVQPNLQFVFNPEGDPQRDIASVATVRFTVEF